MGLESINNKVATGDPSEKLPLTSPPPPSPPAFRQLFQQTPKTVIIFVAMALSCLLIYHSSVILPFSGDFSTFAVRNNNANSDIDLGALKSILKHATMSNNTIIITSLNDAWAEPHSVFDHLLESFRIGDRTERFLKHLVVVCLDQKAYGRCLKLHPHCYNLRTHGMDFSREAYFMAADYLKMVWKKIDFLRTLLDLGYNFVFTDADIMWFRDPFTQFNNEFDIQISCDSFNENPIDLRNLPNTGFKYVKSNNRTIEFYKFWYNSRLTYPNLHDQDVFNRIKFNFASVGRIRFLDTVYFGGFCQPSNDLNKVCTMHANCCVGLDNKVHDLGVMLNDWRNYTKSLVNQTEINEFKGSWRVPQTCKGSLYRPRAPKKKDGQGRKS